MSPPHTFPVHATPAPPIAQERTPSLCRSNAAGATGANEIATVTMKKNRFLKNPAHSPRSFHDTEGRTPFANGPLALPPKSGASGGAGAGFCHA